MKPLDNETIRTKTVWTDEELMRELSLIAKAIDAVDALGDRYQIVVSDLFGQYNTRLSMVRGRRSDIETLLPKV